MNSPIPRILRPVLCSVVLLFQTPSVHGAPEPGKPPVSSKQTTSPLWHIWSDGKNSVEAEFLSLDGDFVQVRLRSGATHRLNLTKLQPADRIFAEKAKGFITQTAIPTATGSSSLASSTPAQPTNPTAAASSSTAGSIVPTGEVSFRRDVMPVFFRANCNSGGCHGAAPGKDGFRLSLFGYDAAGDYFRLTQQMLGRRIDLAAPEESLLLLKATGDVTHTGGTLFDKKSAYYQILLKWIEQGAQNDSANVAEVTGIRIEPAKLLFQGPSKRQALKVFASYSDGSSRDITPLALYVTNNKTTADINEDGLVTSGRHGATDVFARFNRFTIGAPVVVLPQEGTFEWPPDAKPTNFIDELVFAKLKHLQIQPSGIASDEQFLRRITLDLTGLPPTEDEIRTFVASIKPDKRERLADILLARPEYADVWAARWGDWLKLLGDTNSGSGTDTKAAVAYHAWLVEQFRNNVPLDRFIHAQVASVGSNFSQPETNFYTMLPAGNYEPKAMAQSVAQLCLGIRIQCAECHNHPFDRWTQDDYYGFVSFFTGVRRKMASEPREYYIFNDNSAPPAKHQLDQRPMPPRLLGGGEPNVQGKDPRNALADWLTSPENTLFATSMANRVWSQFFGIGVVDPIDDLRITNPPSNSELFEELGKRLVAYQFDQKRLIRDIVTSRTYQLSSRVTRSNKDDSRQFSHAPVRRLPSIVALDAISSATEAETHWNHHPDGYRGMQIYDTGRRYGSYFLACFGQSDRETSDATKDNREVTLSQTLHLINGDTIQGKIQQSQVVTKLLTAKTPPEQAVESLYLRSLSRKPSGEELAVFKKLAATPPTRVDYDRLWWALLNSTEFLFQH
ncbi:MAG: DUF1549 and DUF1553 domain-containing protein [Verrucomicrobiota bacterium]